MTLDHFGISLPSKLNMIGSSLEVYLAAGEKAKLMPEILAQVRISLKYVKELEEEAQAHFLEQDRKRHSREIAASKGRITRATRPQRQRRRPPF